MPIIFAQALMFIPSTIAQFFPDYETMQGVMGAFINPMGWVYNLTFATLIILFTYFYTAITVNANQISDEMKRNSGFIPGVKPGKATADFIDNVMSRITLPGAFFLAFVAILPSLANVFNINSQFAQFYGGTSLLILVGVVLDTLQQIESHLMMRHYDGLMKSGRIKGRQAAGTSV
jgi:preprotein translocase subunit SecY